MNTGAPLILNPSPLRGEKEERVVGFIEAWTEKEVV
jgi:hypothetical protein